MARHDIGDVLRLWVVFRDETGAQEDPDTVTLTVLKPDGTLEEVTNTAAESSDIAAAEEATGQDLSDETGVYKALVEVDQAGVWWYRWQGEGTVDEVEEQRFTVRRRRVPAVA